MGLAREHELHRTVRIQQALNRDGQAGARRPHVAVAGEPDEEGNDARCLKAFLASDHGFAEAIVAEPTGCTAVLAPASASSPRSEQCSGSSRPA